MPEIETLAPALTDQLSSVLWPRVKLWYWVVKLFTTGAAGFTVRDTSRVTVVVPLLAVRR
jgi:hypothetical protein